MATFNTMPKREKLCNYVADRSQPRNSFSKLRRELAGRCSFRDSPRSAWPANCKTSVENRDNASQGEGEEKERDLCLLLDERFEA